jgi:choline kinase
MTAVILAAGQGRRIASLTHGLPKCFLPLGGRRLIDHQLDSLRRIAVKDIVLVTGYRSDLFKRDYGNAEIHLVQNPLFDQTNVLTSLWYARQYLGEGFYFLHADVYFDPTILDDLKTEAGPVILCVERKETVEEEMKLRAQDGRVVEINKDMPPRLACGEFTGLAKITRAAAPRIVEHIRDRVERQGRQTDFFEAAIQDVIDEGMEVRMLDIGRRVSIEIDFPEDYERARRLYAAQRGCPA